MFDLRTRLSLDEFTAFTPLFSSRSKGSLTCSTDIMFASKTLSSAAAETDFIPKEAVDPSTVRLIHSEVSPDVKCLGMASEPTPSGSLLLLPQVTSVHSSLPSLSVGNLGSSQVADHPSPSMLHLHPFSQGSASGANSGSSSSNWVKSTGTGASSSTFPDQPGPPSSASFMDMGEGKRGKKSHSYEVQSRRGGQSVSDGIPLIAYNVRKRGRRFWHTLIRPSVLSFLDNPKRQETSSTSFASTKLAGSGASSSSLEELPPRPAPYFYPRRVGPQMNELSRENTYESFFCDFGELPTDPPAEVAMHKGNHRTKSQNWVDLEAYGGSGVEEGASLDSNEIETWRKRQADLVAKKLRPSLRQRFGSSLRQSIGLQQLRSAFSEMDLPQLARQQDDSETLGPGITDDPFASLTTSPQLLPTEVILLPAASSSSNAPTASLTPTVSQAPTTFLPLLCSSEFVLDFTNPVRDMKRRSFINMDPDYDNPSSSSSVSRSDNSHQPHSPSFPYENGLSVLGSCLQGDNGQMPTSIPHPQLGQVSKDLGILCQTPVLTPDLDSIADSTPSLSDSFCVAVDATSLKLEQDFSRTHTVPFPTLRSSLERPPMPDLYEESAVEEGSSQDQIFHPCALELLPSSVSLNSVGSNNPKSRRKFSLRGVGGEYLRDVSVASIDMAESITDFTLLAVEWPQPPSQTSPEPGPTSEDTEDECFTLVDQAVTNSLHIQEGEHPRSPPSECQGAIFTKPLTFDRRETPTTRVKSAKLASSVDLVEVTIGSSVLTHATLPNILVLTPNTDTQPTGTSISFRAASRPVLISFFAFHAETRLEAQSVSREGTSILAYVTLCTAADHNQANPDKTTVTLMNNCKDSSLMSAVEDGSVTFSVSLPITLGELAVAIAKISFGKDMVSDVK